MRPLLRIRRASLSCLAALLGGVLAGCGNFGAPPPPVTEMVAKIQTAADSVQHSGVRRFESFYALDGVQYHQAYTERVFFDGQGGFAIEPDQVFANLTMNAEVFKLLQASRAGWVHRYRDFRVSDLGLFAQSYGITTLGTVASFLGRPSWRIEIQRKTDPSGGPGSGFELTIDLETGLVLAYEERADGGTVLSRMAYESIDFAPDLSGVQWHTQGNQEQPVDLGGDLYAQAGFTPLTPKAIPPGYGFLEASTVVDQTGRTWFKVTLTDGVEHAFFLHAEPEPAGSSAALSGSGAPVKDDHVYVWQAGNVTVMQGTVNDHDLIAVGKVGKDGLLEMLDSSLP